MKTDTRPAATIYIYLPDEGVDVWRPVQAERIRDGVFHILLQPYDRTDEKWEFEPGELVVCEQRSLEGGSFLVATKRYSPTSSDEEKG